MSEQRLRVNADNVVFEEVDGEVIAIDLANGSYYSVSGSGPAIWGLLQNGATPDEIAAVLGARFEAEPGAIQTAVGEFVDRLRESELLVAADAGEGPVVPDAAGERTSFEQPVFERYTDMKDYFLLDPIHEVNPAAGWPQPGA